MAKPAFINLWHNYPTESSPCDGGYENQCAIRMSLTLDIIANKFLTFPLCCFDQISCYPPKDTP
jgi:hypothetical protein